MTPFEIATTILSLAAIAISLYAVLGQHRLQKECNEVQRATADLAKKQLELLVREDQGRNTARLTLDLVKENRSSFKFVIANISDTDARDVDLKLLLDNPDDNPLVPGEVKRKLPALQLTAGASMSLIAALHLGSPTAFRAELSWTNPNGGLTVEQTYVSL